MANSIMDTLTNVALGFKAVSGEKAVNAANSFKYATGISAAGAIGLAGAVGAGAGVVSGVMDGTGPIDGGLGGLATGVLASAAVVGGAVMTKQGRKIVNRIGVGRRGAEFERIDENSRKMVRDAFASGDDARKKASKDAWTRGPVSLARTGSKNKNGGVTPIHETVGEASPGSAAAQNSSALFNPGKKAGLKPSVAAAAMINTGSLNTSLLKGHAAQEIPIPGFDSGSLVGLNLSLPPKITSTKSPSVPGLNFSGTIDIGPGASIHGGYSVPMGKNETVAKRSASMGSRTDGSMAIKTGSKSESEKEHMIQLNRNYRDKESDVLKISSKTGNGIASNRIKEFENARRLRDEAASAYKAKYTMNPNRYTPSTMPISNRGIDTTPNNIPGNSKSWFQDANETYTKNHSASKFSDVSGRSSWSSASSANVVSSTFGKESKEQLYNERISLKNRSNAAMNYIMNR